MEAIVAIFIALYIPGSVLVGPQSGTVLSIATGLVLWAWQAYLFGFLGLRWLTYLYLGIFVFVWFRKKHWRSLRISKLDPIILIIFLIGVFGQVNRFIPTGFVFPKGVYIYTAASDDAFWHGALTNQLAHNFPPFEPGLSGVAVTNYHYWANMVIAEFVRVFGISVMKTQFVYAPLLFSFLLGALSYVLLADLGVSRIGRIIGIWMVYFSSDINYLISFVTKREFALSVHPLEDGTMFWENPPRAASFVITLTGLILLLRWVKTKHAILGFLTAAAFGSVVGFKVHTGIAVLGGMAALARRHWRLAIAVLLLALLVYLPVNSKSGLPIVAPFEMARMYAVQEKLGLSFLELRRRIYGEHFNVLRVLQMDMTMLILFFLGQFGIRNVGWFGIWPSVKRSAPLGLFIAGGVAASTVFGTLFIQPVAGADIFNAYLATSLFLWIAAVLILDRLIRKLSMPVLVMLLLFVAFLTVPRWVYKTYMPLAAVPAISSAEIEAMTYIRKNSSKGDVIAVFNTGQWDSMYPYVSIYTSRPMYLSGQTILERHGISFSHQASVMSTLRTTKDIPVFETMLDAERISILYFYGEPELNIALKDTSLTKIFSNASIWVYRNTI